MDLEQNIYKTFNEINKKRIKYKLEPKKRITRDIVEQTILNIINDTPPGGDIQKQEKEIFAFEKVMFQ
jgi:predicted oxidoreductase (fatty acid repression mutant protein)